MQFFRSEELKQELDDVDSLTEVKAGRIARRVPEGLGGRRGGGPRLAGGVLGVQGGQGGHERLLACPGEAAPRAARQRRGPRTGTCKLFSPNCRVASTSTRARRIQPCCSSSRRKIMEGAISVPANTRVAVVTGGNKGIGLEVCRQLAGNGVTVVLTARDEARGGAAVEKLGELGLSDVIFHQLEITDASSIGRLAEFLKTRFGRLDILVNNAAIGGVQYAHDTDYGSVTTEEKETLSAMDMDQRFGWLWENCRETYDTAKKGLRTNYYGTKQVIEALLPLLQASSDGRIVNVSSHFGQLRIRSTSASFCFGFDPTRRLSGSRRESLLSC
ncbi:hypothetical protein SETIT_7G179000v2 [Setaria italica]|uniref:(+)-neomenthol dehydrogenase n=1 Tax=Setaria italica TaxID=4555 RepID=A0A368RWW4_SETIT|nr:hypothetical protein SETIT_7G179000v2 [Setaria italica]